MLKYLEASMLGWSSILSQGMYQIVSQGEVSLLFCHFLFVHAKNALPGWACQAKYCQSLSSECACRSLAPPCDRNDV